MIKEAVQLLERVDPSWRFTYWGEHRASLEGLIRVWCIPMDYYRPDRAGGSARGATRCGFTIRPGTA